MAISLLEAEFRRSRIAASTAITTITRRQVPSLRMVSLIFLSRIGSLHWRCRRQVRDCHLQFNPPRKRRSAIPCVEESFDSHRNPLLDSHSVCIRNYGPDQPPIAWNHKPERFEWTLPVGRKYCVSNSHAQLILFDVKLPWVLYRKS